MNPAASMTIATGLTVARALTRPDALTARTVARVLIGGTFATAGLLLVAQWQPEAAQGLGVVVMLTAVLVHGVPLSNALLGLVD